MHYAGKHYIYIWLKYSPARDTQQSGFRAWMLVLLTHVHEM